MAVIVKCDPAPLSAQQILKVEVPAYKGASPEIGERAYVWTAHVHGGQHLQMRGAIKAVHKHEGRIELEIHVTDTSVARPLTYEQLRPHRDTGDGPLGGLARIIVKHALNKVAELGEAEASLLDTYFS